MAALWFLVVPGLSHAFGYLPIGRLTGSGVDVPKGVGLDWTRWGRSPRYMLDEEGLAADHCFRSFTGPLRCYAIDDDELAPAASVRWLCERFERAERELTLLQPRQIGSPRIGHFGPFRPRFKDTLWSEFAGYLAG